MNAEGIEFLKTACEQGRYFAERHDSLASAWAACTKADWLLWALDQLGHDGYNRFDYQASAQHIKDAVGNPFLQVKPKCVFCVGWRPFLTTNEQRWSEITGGVPRCMEHLKQISLDIAA